MWTWTRGMKKRMAGCSWWSEQGINAQEAVDASRSPDFQDS